MELYDRGDYLIMVILTYVEHDFSLKVGSVIAVFKILVCEKKIDLDLSKEINLAGMKDGKSYGSGISMGKSTPPCFIVSKVGVSMLGFPKDFPHIVWLVFSRKKQ